MLRVHRTAVKAMMWAVLLAASFASSGCGHNVTAEAPEQSKAQDATVRYVKLEGGCWAMDTASGQVQPVGLPPEFRVDGLQVSVVLEDANDVMSACQVGPLKRVVSIRKRQ